MENVSARQYDSPLWRLIETEWPRFDEQMQSPVISAEDALRYVLWCLDCIKDSETDTDTFCNTLWSKVHAVIRLSSAQRGDRPDRQDLQLATNAVCAFFDICWGLLLTLSPAHRRRYTQIVRNLTEHNAEVQQCRRKINELPWTVQLKPWLVAYMQSEVFYTMTDGAAWNDDEESYELTPNGLYGPTLLRADNVTIKHSRIDNFYEGQNG